ncbi:MAG TPA: response regulator [Abditibacteriaceae bacterium]|jgi:DNA-binding NtrC family response regulator
MADILLVDDDGNVLLTMAIALQRKGHTVTMASDGARAVEHLQKTNFQFLVSDVRMPGMSGFDLARVARSLAHPPRIILTSAYSNIGTPDGLAEAFIQKPVDVSVLDELLHHTAPEKPAEKRQEKRSERPPLNWNTAFANGH